MKLVGAYPLFTPGHKMKSQKPFMQLDMGIFTDCPHSHGERLATAVALIKTWAMALALKLGDLFGFAAMRANRAIRPAKFFEVLSGFVFIGENGVCEVCTHGLNSL
jgi:hypothetical protein